MQVFKTRSKKLSGTSYGEVRKQALFIFKQICKKTKRRPYIRSLYFKKQKIFFDFFWIHLGQKNPRERFLRLKYFAAAVDLLEHSFCPPFSQANPHVFGEILHRFAGLTKEGDLFYAQVKEGKKTSKKYFMSCFGEK